MNIHFGRKFSDPKKRFPVEQWEFLISAEYHRILEKLEITWEKTAIDERINRPTYHEGVCELLSVTLPRVIECYSIAMISELEDESDHLAIYLREGWELEATN